MGRKPVYWISSLPPSWKKQDLISSLCPLFSWSIPSSRLADLESGFVGQWCADVNLSTACVSLLGFQGVSSCIGFPASPFTAILTIPSTASRARPQFPYPCTIYIIEHFRIISSYLNTNHSQMSKILTQSSVTHFLTLNENQNIGTQHFHLFSNGVG